MAIFLDTGFYVGLLHPKDEYYKRSYQILTELKTGIHGQIFTSNLIMSESATLVALRTQKNPRAMQIIQQYFIGNEQIAIILRLNEDLEKDAWTVFQELNSKKTDKVISFVDCTNIALCRHYSIEKILSYDDHFDGWLTRIF